MTRGGWLVVTVMTMLSALMLAGAWRGLGDWRLYSASRDLIQSDDSDQSLRPDEAHLRAIRKLRFTWNALVESGGPVVDPMRPYGSFDMAGDLGPIIGSSDPAAIAQFHVETIRALLWLLKNGNLPAGRYPLSQLDNASIESATMAGTKHLSEAQIAERRSEIPVLDPDRTFGFTSAHRELLKNLRFGWPNPGLGGPPFWGTIVPAVNFKRPFGDMSSFDIDMAAILGRPRPVGREFDPALWRLYMEMLPALQVFAEHAQPDAPR